MALSRSTSFNVASAAAESAYDTEATIDNMIAINVGSIPQEAVQVVTDSDKAGGNEEATDGVVFAHSVAFDLGINRVKPFALGFFGAFGIGAVASAAADTSSAASAVKQHACTPVATDTMSSFSFESWKDSSNKTKFTGGLVGGFNLTVSRGANRMVDFTASVIGSGSTATAGVAAQTEPVETQLNAATAGIWIDDNPLAAGKATASSRSQALDTTTSDLASPTDLASIVRNVGWSFDNGVSPDDLYRVGGGLVLSAGKRTGRNQTLTIDFDYSDDTYIAKLKNQSETSFELMVRGGESATDAGYYHGFNLIFPVMQLLSVEIADDAGTLVNRTSWQIMDDDGGTHPSVYFDVFNEEAAYMA